MPFRNKEVYRDPLKNLLGSDNDIFSDTSSLIIGVNLGNAIYYPEFCTAFGCLSLLSWLVEPASSLFLSPLTTNITKRNNEICIAKLDESVKELLLV